MPNAFNVCKNSSTIVEAAASASACSFHLSNSLIHKKRLYKKGAFRLERRLTEMTVYKDEG